MITLNCIRLFIRYTFQSYFLQRSIHLCRTYKFLTNYFSHCAVWILCVISIERAAVTRRIYWNQNVFNHKHSYCTLVIIFTILFFLNIHYLIFFGSEQEKNVLFLNNQTETKLLAMCSSNLIRPPTERYEIFLIYYFSWADFIINSLIPFIIILIANASVMHTVYQSRILMRELGIRQTRSPRDTQMAYILFVSTFLFLLLTFPLRVFSAIEPYLKYEKRYFILLDGIMRFLLYLDHGCGFYLYTFTGELFRRELKKVFYELIFLLCGRRVSNWSSVESRRHSELSCSNGTAASPRILSSRQKQHGHTQLQDSTSSGVGVKSSIQLLQLQKHLHQTSYHQCIYVKQHPINSFSTSSSPPHTIASPPIGQEHSFDTTANVTNNQNGRDERYSSSCFESQYEPVTLRLASSNNSLEHDLDRKSDIA